MPGKPTQPPRLADRLLKLVCAPYRLEEVQGDLHEEFAWQVERIGERRARWRYWRDVLGFFKPFAVKRERYEYTNPTPTTMLSNYLKIAFRNLTKNKVYSFINIAGLSAGMAVALLIGLWIYDELSYDKYHQQYDRLAQVMQHQTYNGQIGTQEAVPLPIGAELRKSYGSDFSHVVMSSWIDGHILTVGEKALSKMGAYMEPQAPDMLTLRMLRGSRAGLAEPASILLAESVAKTFFGDADPVGKLMKIDNRTVVKVTGVYEDLPHNTSLRELSFILPWELNLSSNKWITEMPNPWRCNCFQTFAQIADHADFDKVSARIKAIKIKNIHKEELRYRPEVFLNPMSKWHLYSEFKDGLRVGGRIEFIWLFGSIGVFVLLLACINFMNLSTARSEKRAKEVGIRKAVGSVRSQLIAQFFSESFLVVIVAFVVSMLLVQLILPSFNEVADKQLTIPFTNPLFWLLCLSFSLLTGFLAGSYPALYLSSFQAINVLKGTFRVGRLASVPRKVLVVVQFTVSVTLIIGTIIVFRQIQFAKNRPVGYTRDGLVMLQTGIRDIHTHFTAFREELIKSGAITEVAESSGPTTAIWSTNGGLEWKGKDPGLSVDFPNTAVSYDFGKTVNWKFIAGRDFSRTFATDSTAFVINQTAANYMGFKNRNGRPGGSPVGEIIRWDGKPFRIIGVINDMVVESPYKPVRASLFHLSAGAENVVTLKINPARSASQALATIETAFKKYNPALPFEYKFVDDEYAKKFGDEERIGKLASFFAVLAIFISCLGIFGLASFIAEQRTKEIGVRKVLGASVLNLWALLSRDFVLLVLIAFCLATPTAWYFLGTWLQKYDYRTDISWWIFGIVGIGALLITLLTVSYQAVKAALMNPVKSLRSE